MNDQRKIAVFDFDGTLTTHDTLLLFIRYAVGIKVFLWVFFLHVPLILLMLLKIYPNWRVKQSIFSKCFKGMPYQRFEQLGKDFADVVNRVKRSETIATLVQLRNAGICVYVISASIEEWVKPFCMRIGVRDVLCTKVEVDACGYLTGRFLSKNCYGQEKVNRFLHVEPERTNYYLMAYGDSRGDKELLDFADEGHLV